MANFGGVVLDTTGLNYAQKQDISQVLENMKQLTPNKRNRREKNLSQVKTADMSIRGHHTQRDDMKRCSRGDLQLNQPFHTPGVGKYNLNPDFQHVQATYMNVGRAVEKLRKQKDERIRELQEKKRIAEDRLPQWGAEKKKKRTKSTTRARAKKKQSELPVQTIDSCNLVVFDEM